MLYKRREKIKKINEKVGAIFSKLPMSPDAWSVFSVVIAVACAYTIYKQYFAVALIFFAVSAFSDVIDGAVARWRKRATKRGAYLDTIADRYVEFIVLFAIYLVSDSVFFLSAREWIVLVIFGSIMTTYAKAAGAEKGVEICGGIMGRAERLAFIFMIILSLWIFPEYSVYLIALMAVLVNISPVQRIMMGLKDAKSVN